MPTTTRATAWAVESISSQGRRKHPEAIEIYTRAATMPTTTRATTARVHALRLGLGLVGVKLGLGLGLGLGLVGLRVRVSWA